MTSNKTNTSKDSTNSGNYAIVETSGTQFWLESNRYYDLDRINASVDDTITIDKVLLLNDEKGLSIGKPYVKGASVELKVMAHKRGPKIIVYKMRPKKKTRTKNGHRQELTRVMVTSISNGLSSYKVFKSARILFTFIPHTNSSILKACVPISAKHELTPLISGLSLQVEFLFSLS